MSSPSDELADLRRRVAALEEQVRVLSGLTPDQPNASPPPLPVSHSISRPHSQEPPIPPKPRRELSSSVIVASIGGFIFLLGAIYALTVSIQRGWISPSVRVLLGNGVGALLAGVAIALMKRERHRLGLVLLTAGLGTVVFACYYGGLIAYVIDPALGFGGAVIATGVAGWTAARFKFSGAMVAATALSLISPLIFWQDTAQDNIILSYLLAIVLAQAAVYYLTQTGAQWRIARWMGLGALAVVAASHTGVETQSERLLGWALLTGIYAGTLVIVWLPRHQERPGHAVGLTTSISAVMGLGYAWSLDVFGWPDWVAAIPLGLQAVLLVILIPFARRRLGDASADAGLAVTAAGFSLVAVLVVLRDSGDLLIWAVVALAATVAARFGPESERSPLRAAAILYLGFASIGWMIAVQERLGPEGWLFLNSTWLGGIVLAIAWWQFAGIATTTGSRRFAQTFAQVIAVHALAMEWIGRAPVYRWDDAPLAALLGTLTYAMAGLIQWYVGVRQPDPVRAKPLRIVGYVWIGIATAKLFLADLANASTESRAIAALVVGALFIAAALLVDRLKPAAEPPDLPPIA